MLPYKANRNYIKQLRISNLYQGLCIARGDLLSMGDLKHCMDITQTNACMSVKDMHGRVLVWFCAKNKDIITDIIGHNTRCGVSTTGGLYHSVYIEVFPNIPKSFNEKVATEILFEIS